ncbi:U3-containing 90S pre-ribosomal complex subunit-domain containing protein [Panaeolus papilionaceus]|nr:U3-containing 90S pre-ribosomal complex subunit-domain containing protein [Panaeolus papilionaceus]
MAHQRGDDLDDDFVPDDIVALSGDEEVDPLILDDEDVFVNPEDDDPQSIDSEDDTEQQPSQPQNTAGTDAKKRKRREKQKERKAKKRKLTEAVETIEGTLAQQAPNELANYLVSMQSKSFTQLSAIEMEDLRIPASSIADTTSWTSPRTLDQLVNFIVKTLPGLRLRLSQRSKSNGAPTLLYIAPAALRVADVTRILKDKTLRGEKGADVAKLFAKHFKLSEHVTYLRRTKIGSAVGTPGRLGKLLCEADALNTSALSHIILDVTFKDVKERSLLDIPETRNEVFQTVLNNKEILSGLKSGKIQLVLF